MKKRNVILATLIVVVTLTAVPFVFAAPHGGRGGHHGDALGMLLRAKEELNLSDAQVTEIKGIFRSLREQNEQNRDQLRDGHGEILSTLIANPSNVAAAQRILDDQLAAERALKANMLQAASKALTVLTPEQRTRLAELVGKMRERREARMQRFNGARPNSRR